MKNRNKRQQRLIPESCPKCKSVSIVPDCSRYGENFVHGWHCVKCGYNSDNEATN